MRHPKTIVMAIALAIGVPTHAQLGNILNKARNTVNSAKEVKNKVESTVKKANNDIDFTYRGSHRGSYRSRNRKIMLDALNASGKNITYTINKSNEIIDDSGNKIGEFADGGIVNCNGQSPYLTYYENGEVVMDGNVVGKVLNTGRVYVDDIEVGYAPGIESIIAAYIYFGVLNDKSSINEILAMRKEQRIQEEVRRQELAKVHAAEAEERAAAAKTSTSSSGGSKSTSTSSAPKVKEYTVQKGSSKGYVDANGVVYNWAHKKLGELPKGSGYIKNDMGSSIGRISMGDIYNSSGRKVASVTSGGSISVEGANKTVAEVHAGGRIDMVEGSKTLGYCEVRPYEWAVALIFCDFFKF